MPKKIMLLIAAVLVLKVGLFVFAEIHAPEAKIQADSHSYLDSSMNFFPHFTFAKTGEHGTLNPEFFRTPGYPLFLGIFHDLLNIPLNGILIIQIVLTIVSAIIVYKAADKIDPKLGMIAFLIILFDPAITVHSLMILTESLYLFLMSIFLYRVVNYIQNNTIKDLIIAAIVLAAATYVRPISFYLGGFIAVFIFLTNTKNRKHAFLFFVIVYSLLFCWQARNHHHFQQWKFSSINNATVDSFGLYKSYARNEDPYSQGLPPALYYANVSSRNLMSLMTRPVSFKYFGSDTLKKVGKILSYPWIAFWIIGLLVGIIKIGKKTSYHFLLLVIFYFTAATIIGVMWIAGPRFRIPMMPFIAILSSYGWTLLINRQGHQ